MKRASPIHEERLHKKTRIYISKKSRSLGSGFFHGGTFPPIVRRAGKGTLAGTDQLHSMAIMTGSLSVLLRQQADQLTVVIRDASRIINFAAFSMAALAEWRSVSDFFNSSLAGKSGVNYASAVQRREKVIKKPAEKTLRLYGIGGGMTAGSGLLFCRELLNIEKIISSSCIPRFHTV